MKLDDRNVLVTGGAGFIGSHLVDALLSRGNRVTVIDDFATGKRENLAHHAGNDRLNVVEADITKPLPVDFHGLDAVFHLACLGVRHSIHAPMRNHEVNATGSLLLLQAARAANVPRFVYVSSSEVYGTAQSVPMPESHPTYPMTVYGASKLAGECYTRAYHRTYDYPTIVVRPFNAYGPRCHHEGDSGEVIPKFLLRAMAGQPMMVFGDGTQTRDFTFVTDTARGIIAAAESDDAIGGTFNLGYGSEITVNELAREIATLVGVDAKVEHIEQRPGDVLRLYSDSTRAQSVLGFRPTISLRDGLKRLHQWYADQAAAPETLLQQERVRNWQTTETA